MANPCDGSNKLVLLAVDPYLMHAYWELASIDPPAKNARPILRFHESAGTLLDRRFDVEINLAAEGWYVPLWSPDKTYFADLGWRNQDGSFLPLARSKVVRTPPAWPNAEIPVDAPKPSQPQETAVPDGVELLPVEAPPVVPEPVSEAPPPAPEPVEVRAVDLTEYAEERFTPGVSSSRDPLGE